MSVARQVKVLEAKYIKGAQSIVILGECEEGKLRNQIHKSCFSFGDRTEEEIDKELEKTAEMMIGKIVKMVFHERRIF